MLGKICGQVVEIGSGEVVEFDGIGKWYEL